MPATLRGFTAGLTALIMLLTSAICACALPEIDASEPHSCCSGDSSDDQRPAQREHDQACQHCHPSAVAAKIGVAPEGLIPISFATAPHCAHLPIPDQRPTALVESEPAPYSVRSRLFQHCALIL